MASSLTIAPALGHSLVTAQGMAGGYDAIDDRSFWQVGLQEGAVGSGDFMVTERGAGANMTVDVACNTGFVLVEGDTVSNQGLYVVRPHTAVANLDIATAHATNPRVDSVVVQVDDDEHDAGGNTRARVMVLSGTATGGATLDNRTGAPALPSSAMLLADVLVPATDTTISNTQIRDRRKWARGAYRRILRNANAAAGNDYAVGTSVAIVDSTNLSPRIECSGAPLRFTCTGLFEHPTSDRWMQILPRMDGVAIDGGAAWTMSANFASIASGFSMAWDLVPTAGSHTFAPYAVAQATAGFIRARADSPFEMVIEELVRQNIANNSVTSG